MSERITYESIFEKGLNNNREGLDAVYLDPEEYDEWLQIIRQNIDPLIFAATTEMKIEQDQFVFMGMPYRKIQPPTGQGDEPRLENRVSV